jgi:large subunit ribosomal protein L22
MEYRASHRYADMSARKIRPFAALVRGKSLDEALQLLRFAPNRGARLLEQVLLSARGNALDKGARDVEDLIVGESRVDDGPIFKRFMPRARGTAYPILRRTAHIRVMLVEEQQEESERPDSSFMAPKTTTPTESAAPAPVVVNEAAAPAPVVSTEKTETNS